MEPVTTAATGQYGSIATTNEEESFSSSGRPDSATRQEDGRTTVTRNPDGTVRISILIATAMMLLVVMMIRPPFYWMIPSNYDSQKQESPQHGTSEEEDVTTTWTTMTQNEGMSNPASSHDTTTVRNTTYQKGLWFHETQKERLERCGSMDWIRACQAIEGAGARRRKVLDDPAMTLEEDYSELEQILLNNSEDDTVVFDENCLRVYRLNLQNGERTFPYHASNLLRSGGNQTMALFIQHGAGRDADAYFCSFRKLMVEQTYRPFNDIMVVAPDFNYRRDDGVIRSDAFWNTSKPWGDWRVGAESDPDGWHNHATSVSSFDVLDHMLKLLTDSDLYPHMEKISYLGHSAGGQMVQRYALTSQLAAHYDRDPRVDLEFIVANPSSYTYLTSDRWNYDCGNCSCTSHECRCNRQCTPPDSHQDPQLTHPHDGHGGTQDWPCHDSHYDRWPYGMGIFSDHNHSIPYVLKSDPERSRRLYPHRHVVYMVGQNDTCNDALPLCDKSCWKKDNFDPETEWPCYRNHMDTRCPAMLEGPNRRTRGLNYMKYLEQLYGQPTHVLHVIPNTGHDAAGMFGSDVGMREIFD